MHTLFLGLGSNLDNREKYIKEAIEQVERSIGKVIHLSTLYHTKPWGFESTNGFLNAAAEVQTELNPTAILKETQNIEKRLGRNYKSLNGIYKDRTIDIDILLYDDEIIDHDELKIPHPLMHKRSFVMKPLAEIAPCKIHPIIKKSMAKLEKECPDE